MAEAGCKLKKGVFEKHRPVFDDVACSVMGRIRVMDLEDIRICVGISAPMALQLKRMSVDFMDKSTGVSAIESFTGVVFRALDYCSLTSAAKKRLVKNIRIVSSLYGWLRADDVVKEYRLDYGVKISPEETSMSKYWKPIVTNKLISELEESNDTDILNLLPGDAAKCIDWKRISSMANVCKVDFKEECMDGLKTPDSSRLKTLRGLLLRAIAEKNIKKPEQLLRLATDEFFPMKEDSTVNHVFFRC